MIRDPLEGQLVAKLSPDEKKKLVKSYDIVGDIAILKVAPELEEKRRVIADAVMAVNRNVRTVLRQVGSVSGEFRLRKLEWVAGEKRTSTTYRESGCAFRVNLSEVYFSPRLSFERMRIGKLVKEGEVAVNMFAGVGCFSIIIAKHSKAGKVYSIDINPVAVKLMMENIVLNKVENRVEAISGDAEKVVKKKLIGVSNRVLMPLPAKAYEYLDSACLALEPGGGFIHYYNFVHAGRGEDPIRKVVEDVREKLILLQRDFEVSFSRVVRTVGPNWYQVVLDLKVH